MNSAAGGHQQQQLLLLVIGMFQSTFFAQAQPATATARSMAKPAPACSNSKQHAAMQPHLANHVGHRVSV